MSDSFSELVDFEHCEVCCIVLGVILHTLL